MAPEDKPGFTVSDRRSFNQPAEKPAKDAARAEREAAEAAAAAGGPARDQVVPPGEATSETTPEATSDASKSLPPVDFHTFVLSLGSSALLHLGELEHPETGRPQRDLGLAKHTIDVLSMLKVKTKGNLTPAEDNLLDGLLYDLRLRYVEAAKAPS